MKEPKIEAGEVWLGNTSGTEVPEHYKQLKTIRVGEQAYDINGKELDPKCYRPLIMKKSEQREYDKIYARRMSLAYRGLPYLKIVK